MIVKTRAIVLKNTNYSESSVISKMYTREYGLRTYIIQSVRKGKSAIRPSMIQPLSLVRLDIYEKQNANIQRIKELKNEPLLVEIQDSMIKKSVALFLIEVLNQCIMTEHYEEELFDFLEEKILYLEQEKISALYPINFLIELTSYLGIQPQGKFSEKLCFLSIDEGVFVSEYGLHTISKEASLLISQIIIETEGDEPWSSRTVRQETLEGLMKYYQYHVTKNKKIRSVEILSELFN